MTMISERNILSGIGRLLGLVLAAVCILSAPSCSEDEMKGLETSDPQEGYISICLYNSEMRTRDTESDDQYNENRIARANVYLFPATATDADVPTVSRVFTFSDTYTETDVKIKLDQKIIKEIFPDAVRGDGTYKARAYVVANLPQGYTMPENPTLGDLRSLPITSDFASVSAQSSFVMNGEDDITLKYDRDNLSKSYVTGEIHLKRAAAKISLSVSMKEEVTDGQGVVWRPVGATMNVLVHNGVNKSRVTPTYKPEDLSYFSTSTRNGTQRGFTKSDDAEDQYPWKVTMPVYTYPNIWSQDDQESMTYLTLNLQWTNGAAYRNCYYMVPVVRSETKLVRNVSYQVKIHVGVLGNYTPEEPLKLEDVSYRAVNWGDAPVNVDIADYRYLVVDQESFVLNNEDSGAFSFYSSHEVEVTNVTMTYYAYNTNAQGIRRAITVSQDVNDASAARNNDNGLYECDVLNDEETGQNVVNEVTGTRTLVLDHDLVQWTPYSSNGNVVVLGPNASGYYPSESYMQESINSITYYTPTDNAAYSIYEFEITIAHKDDSKYTETIKVTQYPAIYIEVTQNYYSTTTANNTPQRANVYVNGNQAYYADDSSVGYWCSVARTNSSNPNMYVVTITNLSDNEYVIGDPRQTTIDNLTYENNTDGYFTSGNSGVVPRTRWDEAPALSGASPRRLSYYYPTNSDETYMYRVAPQIRVSSFYSNDNSRSNIDEIKRRCAGYQEMGYPAGRWRLPTLGELQFIMNLWHDKKIPPLFKETTTSNGETVPAVYWTAQGRIPVTLTDGKLDADLLESSAVNNRNGHVRCVYDEWYWKDKPMVTSTGTNTWAGVEYGTYPFTWGDVEINWPE